MNNERLFDESAERDQDKRAIESLNKLDSYLNSESVTKNGDYLDTLQEEDDVKIEDLRRLIEQLEEMKKEYEFPNKDGIQGAKSQNAEETKGKNLTKSLPSFKNTQDTTAKEIASSFISCFILCMITAIMGTGWFIYIINHI